jgi:hypothetical protein
LAILSAIKVLIIFAQKKTTPTISDEGFFLMVSPGLEPRINRF